MLLVEGVNGLTLPEPIHTSALPAAIISISFRAGILIRCCAGNATESDRYRSALAAAEAIPKQVRLEVLARCRVFVLNKLQGPYAAAVHQQQVCQGQKWQENTSH